jgi:thioester reductase-like protein
LLSGSAITGKHILLTGATGLIGGELLRRLAQLGAAGPQRVYCLVRTSADHNQNALLRRLGIAHAWDALVPIFGELRDEAMGVSTSDAQRLKKVDLVIHCAAVTSFKQTRLCEEVNVGGLAKLLTMMSHFDRPPRFMYVSSAAACGVRSEQCVEEANYPRVSDQHWVHYTKTKAIAEEMVRAQRVSSDWLIVRPSIVLPDSAPDQRLVRGLIWSLVLMRDIPCLPIFAGARIDAVPLSFVGDCMIRLIALDRHKYDCYHISSGPQQAAVWRDVLSLLRGVYARALDCCDPSEWPTRKKALTPQERRLAGIVACYLPFINQDLVFANARLSESLGTNFPSMPHYASYLPQLLTQISFQDALAGSRDP